MKKLLSPSWLLALLVCVSNLPSDAAPAPKAQTQKEAPVQSRTPGRKAGPGPVLPVGVPFTGNAGAGSINPDGTSAITNTGDRGTGTANPLTWQGAASGGASATEATGVDGINHDYFVLTVNGNQTDWIGKVIFVTIDWTVPASDYDLFVHKGTETGEQTASDGRSAPGTRENVTIVPSNTGVGVYYITVNYFNVPDATAQPYLGKAVMQALPPPRVATYTHGGITFSPNSTVKAPTTVRDGEPSSRVDPVGNYYISGIRGVPAGVDLWYFDLRSTSLTFDPNMRSPVYRGQPDSTTSTSGQDQLQGGALGGGDIDIAVGFSNYTGLVHPPQGSEPVPVIAYASLTAANVTVGNSLDRGATFAFNGAGNIGAGVPVNDREWMGFIGNNTVYLVYRNFAQGIAFIQQSIDGGFTYGLALPPGGITFPQTGSLEVDQTDGTVYVSSNDGQVAVGIPPLGSPTTAPTSYTVYRAVNEAIDTANIFFPIRVAADHTVYGAYSDGKDVYLVHSSDKGQTWSSPVQVNDPADTSTKLNLMPWLAAGSTPGSVGVAWYGSNHGTNDDNAVWRVYFAQTFNATSLTPQFRIVQASDHSIHAGNISLKGLPLNPLDPAPNRNLIDYFQVSFDPAGAAVIGYTDDHNDFDGATFVMRQTSGPSANGNGSTNVPAPAEGGSLPAQPFALPGTPPPLTGGPAPQPMQPGPNGEQVTDFTQDQDSGLLAVAPANSPVDIVSIKYTSQDSNTTPVITATMKVSDLSTSPGDHVIPGNTTWRMYFTANAPEKGIVNIAGNSYSKGLSDDGDQFFIQAVTNSNGTGATYSWGTTVRGFDGMLTDTTTAPNGGPADSGFFNTANNTITVRVSASKLNTYLTSHGHTLITTSPSTTFCGLRGRAFNTPSSGLATEDLTRGGTEFTIGNPF